MQNNECCKLDQNCKQVMSRKVPLCEMSVIDVLVAMKTLICTKDQDCDKLPLVNYILQVE